MPPRARDPVRIGVDATCWANGRGYGRFARELMHAMTVMAPNHEFVCFGEHRDSPDPLQATDNAWADYVFNRSGAPGVKREWWCHVPSGIWFIAERDRLADQFSLVRLETLRDQRALAREQQVPGWHEHGRALGRHQPFMRGSVERPG